VGEIISARRARSNRNGGRDHPGIEGDFPRNPALSPIEQFFAKLKALLRKAAARTSEALWETTGQLLHLVPNAATISPTQDTSPPNPKMLSRLAQLV